MALLFLGTYWVGGGCDGYSTVYEDVFIPGSWKDGMYARLDRGGFAESRNFFGFFGFLLGCVEEERGGDCIFFFEPFNFDRLLT